VNVQEGSSGGMLVELAVTSSPTPRLVAGFCAISQSLPLPAIVETDLTLAPKDSGMCAAFDTTIYCVAAEPHATFFRVGVAYGRHEVAYESAVLGRLRSGYRVLQLRFARTH
jgi:hypothetical protein